MLINNLDIDTIFYLSKAFVTNARFFKIIVHTVLSEVRYLQVNPKYECFQPIR